MWGTLNLNQWPSKNMTKRSECFKGISIKQQFDEVYKNRVSEGSSSWLDGYDGTGRSIDSHKVRGHEFFDVGGLWNKWKTSSIINYSTQEQIQEYNPESTPHQLFAPSTTLNPFLPQTQHISTNIKNTPITPNPFTPPLKQSTPRSRGRKYRGGRRGFSRTP